MSASGIKGLLHKRRKKLGREKFADAALCNLMRQDFMKENNKIEKARQLYEKKNYHWQKLIKLTFIMSNVFVCSLFHQNKTSPKRVESNFTRKMD